MEKRPSFEEIKTFEEFSKYYWYRQELQEICRRLGIDSSGMKAELNHNIEEYFRGNVIKSQNRNSRRKTSLPASSTSTKKLTPQTSLIECNFRFNQTFRNWFSEQTGLKNFKFNVDMVASARKAKECGDLNFTLGDLLDIFYGRKTYAKYDRSSLQWNKFLQDFCADPASDRFNNKLKAAATLWKEVRDSPGEKAYRHEIMEEFQSLIVGVEDSKDNPTDKTVY